MCENDLRSHINVDPKHSTHSKTAHTHRSFPVHHSADHFEYLICMLRQFRMWEATLCDTRTDGNPTHNFRWSHYFVFKAPGSFSSPSNSYSAISHSYNTFNILSRRTTANQCRGVATVAKMCLQIYVMEWKVPFWKSKSASLHSDKYAIKWHRVANDVGAKHTSLSRSHILFMDVVFNGPTKSSSFRQSF